MDNIIELLRKEVKRVKHMKGESNIRTHIIRGVFLKKLGYDEENSIDECSMVNDFCDLYVPITEKLGLPIEIKKVSHPLKITDVKQLREYAGVHGQQFGLLTNGYEYLLANFHIIPNSTITGHCLESYIIFWFDIFNEKGDGKTELKYFKYLSYQHLYKDKVTSFFSDIVQYREWKFAQGLKKSSWLSYKSTLYRFFDYYIDNELQDEIDMESLKRAYEKIDISVYDRFVKYLQSDGDILSTSAIRNMHSHLRNMLYELEQHGIIRIVGLGNSRKKNLARYKETEPRKPYTELERQDIETILNFLKSSKTSTRDTVIFLMTVTFGLERSQLLQLKWTDFDNKYKYLTVDGRKIVLPKLLQDYVIELKKELGKAKRKSEIVFLKKQKNKLVPMNEWNMNDVFNSFIKISKDKKWEMFSPNYVRSGLILSLYSAKYSMEEIMYITGIDINNISKYISRDEMMKRVNKNIKWESLYDGLLCKEYKE